MSVDPLEDSDDDGELDAVSDDEIDALEADLQVTVAA